MISRVFLSLFVFSFAVSISLAEPEAKVASVDFRELKPLLLELAFANGKNQELQKKYQAGKDSQEKMVKAMQKLMASGGQKKEEGPSYSELVSEETGTSRIEVDKKVGNLARAELIKIIELIFEKKYDLVINRDYSDPVLFTELAIPDVTANVRQYLLKQSSAKVKK